MADMDIAYAGERENEIFLQASNSLGKTINISGLSSPIGQAVKAIFTPRDEYDVSLFEDVIRVNGFNETALVLDCNDVDPKCFSKVH